MILRPPRSTLFPTRRSSDLCSFLREGLDALLLDHSRFGTFVNGERVAERARVRAGDQVRDRKSTRLNSSHEWISYAVFCLKKKKINKLYYVRKPQQKTTH